MPPSDDAIVVVPYDPAWPGAFERERALVADALADLGVTAERVQHVGSTSVPGLPAKPVIDLLIAMDPLPAFAEVDARLSGLGYVGREKSPIPDHAFFRKADAHGRATHHLHVFTPRESARHLAFRDALRADPALAEAYAALKRDLAARHATDRDAYTRGKTRFIERVVGPRPA